MKNRTQWAWLLAASLLTACSGGGGGGGGGRDTTAPTLTSGPNLTVSPDVNTPLVAVVNVQTNEPATLTLHVNDGTRSWSVQPSNVFQRDHTVPVLGLKPNRTHVVRIEAQDKAGNSTFSGAFALVTDPLPANFPPLNVKTVDATSMEPGVTMFSAIGIDPVTNNVGSFIIFLDDLGEVNWYHFAPVQVTDLRRLENGHLLFTYDNFGIREIDMLGNTVAEWWAGNLNSSAPPGAIVMPLDTFHHEVFELSDEWAGDFLTLSTEARTLVNYPGNVLDPTQTVAAMDVIGDVVVEFKRDGTIVNTWKLLDILDPLRLTYDSLEGFWDVVYGRPTADWSHGNAVVPHPTDGSFLVSLRSQDAVVKIDAATGGLVWILGDNGRWSLPWSAANLSLAPGAEWSYKQHAPQITPSGSILLFDNGNARAIPPTPGLPGPNQYSRAVEFEVDEGLGEVRQLWAYGGPTNVFHSSVVGDADLMPTTDNVLVTDGGKDLGTHRYGRIFEVTRDGNERIVFEVEVRDDTGSPPTSWVIYRAERLGDVYP